MIYNQCILGQDKKTQKYLKKEAESTRVQLNTCRVYTIQYPCSRVEEHWKGFKKSPITPVRGDGFMTNSRCPAAIEKVTHVAAEPLNVPYTLASNLNSVCALCVIWIAIRLADRLMHNSKEHAEQAGYFGVSSLYFSAGTVSFGHMRFVVRMPASRQENYFNQSCILFFQSTQWQVLAFDFVVCPSMIKEMCVYLLSEALTLKKLESY